MANIIGNLPDAVLCHILSFLPTKETIATSVLCKRWKLLWRSVPALDFSHSCCDNYNHETCLRFVHMVYPFILFRDYDQPLTRFSLHSSCRELDPLHANAWLAAATQRKVEHLDLSLRCAVDLSSTVLRCKTLVVLRLFNVPLSLNSSCGVYLPLLKILHLIGVAFSRDGDLAQLLSGSPNLEELEAISLDFKSYADETMFRRLSKLVSAHIFTEEFPLEVVDNAQFLCINWIEYSNGLIPEFQNLTHLEFFSYGEGILVLDFIKGCPKLQSLTIYKVNPRLFADCDYSQSVPECISLHLKTFTLKSYAGSKVEFRLVRYIMENAKYLQTMTISCSNDNISQEEKVEMFQKLSLCTRCSASSKLTLV